jgi:hypothetical protein
MIDRSDEYSRKNYYRAEAVAMRRIIAERGYTLAIGWTVPPLTEAERAIDLAALAQIENKDRNRPYTFAGKGLGEVKPAKAKGEAGRKAEYKNLSLDEIQERERERNRRRHDKARGRTAKPAPVVAQPEPVAEREEAAPIGVKRAGLARPLSDKAKAEAIAEIAARAAALSQVKPAKRRTAENPESRREKEKKRREKLLAEFEANPEARERYLAQRRAAERKRRARRGSNPRPNGRIENNGLDRRPKGEQC